ncbi:MAG TPA: Na/Pi cotransporter family protein [Anaerovoracaceae bacterium]|nr:Na/Pi cotransporter family protein [Anaerovoracaceae bacterium]
MDIFSVISLFGGLALFLYGMSVMSQGLERLAGGRLEAILRTMTASKLRSLGLGIGVTAVVQSSSAVTVMLVGLVNSGIMTLDGSIGVIMGSNIGTTVTAWVLSLIGIESSNLFVQLLKPKNFSPILALIGVIMLMSKSQRKKDIGTVFIGFAVLMYGMNFMSSAMKPLAEIPEFTSILTAFNNPLLGIFTGLALTAIIQSSSASVGILQALSLTNGITFGMAIPIIMGQNIGTCITALISSIGVNKNAKRVAVLHITFNLLGTFIFLIIFYGLNAMFEFAFIGNSIKPIGVAIVHSIFNLSTTFVLLPFGKNLVRIAERVIKTDESYEESVSFLDERLLNTSAVALAEASNKTRDMAEISFKNIDDAMKLVNNYDEKNYNKIYENENKVDKYEDKLGAFLIKLSAADLVDKESTEITKLLHSIGDIERISDLAINVADISKEMMGKKKCFSVEADREMKVLIAAMNKVLENTLFAYKNNDIEVAVKVEPIEEVIDDLVAKMKANHIRRLKQGDCTIEQGLMLVELITNFERISDHCSNIAVTLIEIDRDSFGAHEYMKNIKSQEDKEFVKLYEKYSKQYKI